MNISGKIVTGLVLTFGFAACGGGDDESSGVDGNKQLGSLSAPEQQDFCEFVVASEGGAGTVHECDGFSITVPTVASCVADFADLVGCTATVSQGEACALSLGDNPCSPGTACAALIACSSDEQVRLFSAP